MQMKIVLVSIIALHLSVSWAAGPADLYSGEVAVASQTEEDRNQALPEALMQVLQKLSGERELPASAPLDDALNDAARYLRSYRYARVDRSTADGTVNQELRLVAQFMQAEVDRIVQQAGLPRWRQERPSIQLWVVIDDGLGRQLKPITFDYVWETMEDVAAKRGLPVSWPDLDPEAMQLVDMSLVWGGFTDYLVERGAPEDGVAIVAARREGPQWGVRWNLASADQTWTWQTSDIDLQNAMAAGIQQMADEIAAANTIAASDQGAWSVDIDIGGLDDAGAYTTCLNYLQNLSLVNDVEVLGANPGRVQFRLQLNASADHLAETFRQGLVLVPAAALSGYDYEFLP
jgi:hypothetical protein